MKNINLRDAIFNATGGIFGITNSKFKKANTRILQIQEFESTLVAFVGASKFADRRFNALDQKISHILSLIKKELSQ